MIQSTCALADDKIYVTEKIFWKRQKTLWEKEKMLVMHFLLFLQCFQNASSVVKG